MVMQVTDLQTWGRYDFLMLYPVILRNTETELNFLKIRTVYSRI